MRETPVTVVGTLVTDVRPRRVGPDAALVLNFRVASNERWFDKDSENWVNRGSLYLTVNCWRRLAENAASLVKGDPVIVTGKLRTREWTTELGERRSVIELEAQALGPDLSRCAVTVHPRRRDDNHAVPRADLDAAGAAPEPEGADPSGAVDDDVARLAELAAAAAPLQPSPA